jgi:hypothetical protein
MEMDIFTMYAKGMREIQNEELLVQMTANAYPKMGNDDKKKLHRSTFKAAYPREFNNPKNVVKLSDLNKALK